MRTSCSTRQVELEKATLTCRYMATYSHISLLCCLHTCPIGLFRILRSWLGQNSGKGGISLMTPPLLAQWLQSLPPILHMPEPCPMPSCSKAPRGLSVLVRVNGIFTAIAISPSPSLRQCPYRYAIRAGRNLPDKEFRYLRTIIVIAAVYWGFNSQLAPLLLTFQHRAGVSPYTSTFVLAQTCVFAKQSHGLFRCGPHAPRNAQSWQVQQFRGEDYSFFKLSNYCTILAFHNMWNAGADLIPKLRSLYCRVP
jgi:hypothetical protein